MNILTLSAKNCMSHLLLKDTFDHFSFIEGEITTFNTFTIDGFLKKDFFDEAPEDVHSHWKDVREFCFQIIRGKRPESGIPQAQSTSDSSVCPIFNPLVKRTSSTFFPS